MLLIHETYIVNLITREYLNYDCNRFDLEDKKSKGKVWSIFSKLPDYIRWAPEPHLQSWKKNNGNEQETTKKWNQSKLEITKKLWYLFLRKF